VKHDPHAIILREHLERSGREVLAPSAPLVPRIVALNTLRSGRRVLKSGLTEERPTSRNDEGTAVGARRRTAHQQSGIGRRFVANQSPQDVPGPDKRDYFFFFAAFFFVPFFFAAFFLAAIPNHLLGDEWVMAKSVSFAKTSKATASAVMTSIARDSRVTRVAFAAMECRQRATHVRNRELRL
jgi:hypothetical protein